MIPYDDLVVALTTWRARQGLPVAAGAAAAAAAHVPAPKATTPGTGPRTAPPAPPSRGSSTIPPPLAAVDTQDDPMDVDSAALLEEHFENEGDDFAMAFDARTQGAHEAEATAIGMAPSPPNRDSFGGTTDPGEPDDVPPRRGHDDW
jgi:hypothetical protein